MSMRELNLIALGEQMPPGLCWKCSASQNFYAPTCANCGAVNPNVDLDGAIAQQDFADRPAEQHSGDV